jgi:phosphoglycolate phosphatase
MTIFGFDGTLADSFAWFLEAYEQVARDLGLRPVARDEVPSLRGQPPREIMRRFGVPLWRVPQVAMRMRERQARDIEQIALFPGVAAMLEDLATRGVLLAVVTSNAEANVRRVLGPALANRVAYYGCAAPVLGARSRLRGVLRAARLPPSDAIATGPGMRYVTTGLPRPKGFHSAPSGGTGAAVGTENTTLSGLAVGAASG